MKAKNQIESRYNIEYIDNNLSKSTSSTNWLLKLIILVSVLGLLALTLASNGLYPFKKKETDTTTAVQNSTIEPIKAQATAEQETKEEIELRRLEGEKQDLLFTTALAEKQNAANEVKLLSIKNKKQKELVTIQIAENAILTEKLKKLNDQLVLEKTKNQQLNTEMVTHKDKNSELSSLLESALLKVPSEPESGLVADIIKIPESPKPLALADITDKEKVGSVAVVEKVSIEDEVIELSGLLESALNEVKPSSEAETVVVEKTNAVDNILVSNEENEVTVSPSETTVAESKNDNLSNLLEEAISNANSADKDYMATLAGLDEGLSSDSSANDGNLVETEVPTVKATISVAQTNSIIPAKESKSSAELGSMLEEAITNAKAVDKNYLSSLDQLDDDVEITTEKIVETTNQKVAIQKPLTNNAFDYTNAISPSTATQIDAIMTAMQGFKQNPAIRATNKPDKKSLQVVLQKQIDQLLTTKDDKDTQYNVALNEESQIRNNAVRSIIVKQGETLWSISKRAYGKGSFYKKIINANPHILKGDKIFLKKGQTLRVPK